MTLGNRKSFLAPSLVLLFALVAVGHWRLRPSPLEGTWLKTDGAGDMPAEATARLTRSQFTMRYWRDGGVEHVTSLRDGREHPLWAITGVGASYRAELEGSTEVVTAMTWLRQPPTHSVVRNRQSGGARVTAHAENGVIL